MKRYKPLLLTERRSHPELNPHISAWDYLEQYKNDSDVYISFTEIDKIGINPLSYFNTPLGIYCYPLHEFVKKYIKDIDFTLQKDKYNRTIGGYAPFAGECPYINFIRVKDKLHFIEDMYKDYGSNKYDRDKKILEQKYGKDIKLDEYAYSAILDQILNNLGEFLNKNDSSEFYLHHLTDTILDELPSNYDIPRKDIFKAVQKYNKDMQQAIFKQDKHLIEFALKDILSELNLIKCFFDSAIETDKYKSLIMIMWNITRLIAKDLSDNKKQASTKWNLILSKDLGYSGFADKSSKGYIHPSEPMQAVFFNTRAFEVITRVENIPAKKNL